SSPGALNSSASAERAPSFRPAQESRSLVAAAAKREPADDHPPEGGERLAALQALVVRRHVGQEERELAERRGGERIVGPGEQVAPTGEEPGGDQPHDRQAT